MNESNPLTAAISRRCFLQRSAVLAAGTALLGGTKLGANDKLNLGVIGTANRGLSNARGVRGENIVAVCDVDRNFLAAGLKEFSGAKGCTDYRKMLERNDLDGVVISTADHTHAVMAVDALRAGKHVYCEKPLTHTVSEARAVAEAARSSKRVTQMGNQIHSGNHYRRMVELVRSGAIGEVREVHCWAGHLWEPRDPGQESPVPPHFEYDTWLGPLKPRPYVADYHPFNWRRWWAFGGGTLADFCCHLMDLAFWALDLEHPQSVEAEGPPVHAHCAPPWLEVKYQFAARGARPPVQMTWYSGQRRPRIELPQWGNGVLFVGHKGMLLTDYGRHVLLPESDFEGFVAPEPSIPNSIGHYQEWIAACKGRGQAGSPFEYGALLTETGLLGNVAYRIGKRIEWDAKQMRATNAPEAAELIRHDYRAGWGIS